MRPARAADRGTSRAAVRDVRPDLVALVVSRADPAAWLEPIANHGPLSQPDRDGGVSSSTSIPTPGTGLAHRPLMGEGNDADVWAALREPAVGGDQTSQRPHPLGHH